MDRMSYSPLLIVSLCILAILLPACTGRPVSSEEAATDEQVVARAALEKVCEPYQRERRSLLYLYTDLRVCSDVPVSMDWYELEAEGIARRDCFDFTFAGGSLDDLISAVMETVSPEGKLQRVVTVDGVILITTLAAAEGYGRDRGLHDRQQAIEDTLEGCEWIWLEEPEDLGSLLVQVGYVAGTPMHVDWGALLEAGVHPEDPVVIHTEYHFWSLARLLKAILEGAKSREALGYRVDAEGVISVSTMSELSGEEWPRGQAAWALRKDQPRFHMDDIDLETVFDYVRKVSEANVMVRWHALAEVGVDRETSVNVSIGETTLDEALAATLAHVAPDGVLAYEIDEDGVIVISTKADFAAEESTEDDDDAEDEE